MPGNTSSQMLSLKFLMNTLRPTFTLFLWVILMNFPCSSDGFTPKKSTVNMYLHGHYLIDAPRYNPQGIGIGFGVDRRWNSSFLFRFLGEINGHYVRGDQTDASGKKAILAKFEAGYGASAFLPGGRWGAEIVPAIGALFLRDQSLVGANRKSPSISLSASLGLIWRPFFSTEEGYNPYNFYARLVYDRYYFRQHGLGPSGLTVGMGFGVEF